MINSRFVLFAGGTVHYKVGIVLHFLKFSEENCEVYSDKSSAIISRIENGDLYREIEEVFLDDAKQQMVKDHFKKGNTVLSKQSGQWPLRLISYCLSCNCLF